MTAEKVWFDLKSKELERQRASRDGLRTRAIATLSTGAVVFALTQSASEKARLDGWLLAALIVLVVLGFCVAMVLMPTGVPILGKHLDPDSFAATQGESPEESERKLYLDLVSRADMTGTTTSYNRAHFLYLSSVVLLVIEIALVAAHFTTSGAYQATILAATAVFVVIVVAVPLRVVRDVIHQDDGTILPGGFWLFVVGIPAVGELMARRERRRLERRGLRSSLVESVPLVPPVPGVHIDAPPGASDVETAIAAGGDVVGTFASSRAYALGQPAGIVSAGGSAGTESDLLHFSVDRPGGGEDVYLPVFTDMRFMEDPLRKNPDWQALSVLEVAGREILGAVDSDVTIVINPWSDTEFTIPPSMREGAGGEGAVPDQAAR